MLHLSDRRMSDDPRRRGAMEKAGPAIKIRDWISGHFKMSGEQRSGGQIAIKLQEVLRPGLGLKEEAAGYRLVVLMFASAEE
jgi:hypothetical protein